MVEMLQQDFMQTAFLASVLVSIGVAFVGSLVLMNRLTFMAGGVAHAAYGGVGLAFLLGLPVLPLTIAFSAVVAAIMGALPPDRHRTETLVGLFWAGGMAFGVLCLDFTAGYKVDLMSYLFGNILMLTTEDFYMMGAVDGLVMALVALFYRPFLSASFDPDFARTRGINVRLLRMLLLVMVALTVVVTVRLTGIILLIALLSVPAFMGMQVGRSVPQAMAATFFYSLFFCWTGLFLSWKFDVTAGAAIVACLITGYGLQSLFLYTRRRSFLR